MRSAIRSGPAVPTDSTSVGAYIRTLTKDRSWIRRRVDRVVVLSPEEDEVHSSFDIDLARVREIARATKVRISNSLLLPLNVFEKQTFLDIDVKSTDGRTVNVLSAGENSFLSHAAFLADVVDAVGYRTMRERYNPELYELGFRATNPDMPRALAMVVQAYAGATPDNRTSWPAFSDFDLVVSLPVASSAESDSLAIIKTRHIARRGNPRPLMRALASTGLWFYERQYIVPVSERWSNLHFKAAIPDGLRLRSVDVLPDPVVSPTRADIRAYQKALPAPSDYLATSDHLIAFHPGTTGSANDVRLREVYAVRARYSVRLSELLPIVSMMALTLVLLVLARVAEGWTEVLSPSRESTMVFVPGFGDVPFARATREVSNEGAIIALFASLPAFIVAYLVRRNEHFMLDRVLQIQRFLLIVCGLELLTLAGAITVHIRHQELIVLLNWLIVGAALCLLLGGWTLVVSIQQKHFVRKIRAATERAWRNRANLKNGLPPEPVWGKPDDPVWGLWAQYS